VAAAAPCRARVHGSRIRSRERPEGGSTLGWLAVRKRWLDSLTQIKADALQALKKFANSKVRVTTRGGVVTEETLIDVDGEDRLKFKNLAQPISWRELSTDSLLEWASKRRPVSRSGRRYSSCSRARQQGQGRARRAEPGRPERNQGLHRSHVGTSQGARRCAGQGRACVSRSGGDRARRRSRGGRHQVLQAGAAGGERGAHARVQQEIKRQLDRPRPRSVTNRSSRRPRASGTESPR
jgi:hypothetical protein